ADARIDADAAVLVGQEDQFAVDREFAAVYLRPDGGGFRREREDEPLRLARGQVERRAADRGAALERLEDEAHGTRRVAEIRHLEQAAVEALAQGACGVDEGDV